MINFELKSCPCCGADVNLNLTKTISYSQNGYKIGNKVNCNVQIVCGECKLQTAKYECMVDASASDEEIISLVSLVIENWNYRVNNSKGTLCLKPKVKETDQLEVLFNYGLTNRAYSRIRRYVMFEYDGRLKENIPDGYNYKVKIGDVTQYTRRELLRARGIGNKVLQDIVTALAKVGLALKGEQILNTCEDKNEYT